VAVVMEREKISRSRGSLIIGPIISSHED